jgi:hypothetical protein
MAPVRVQHNARSTKQGGSVSSVLATIESIRAVRPGLASGPFQIPPANGAPGSWPCRLSASGGVQPFVQRAWEGSATFREQCRKLAAAGVVVYLGSSAEQGFWGQRPASGVLPTV